MLATGAGPVLGVDVPHDQANGDLDRRGERHAALAALVHVVLRLLQLVADELQGRPPEKSSIGNTLLKTACRPISSRSSGRGVGLEERVVGPLLDLDEVADLDAPWGSC
jgi:hypothetical protein